MRDCRKYFSRRYSAVSVPTTEPECVRGKSLINLEPISMKRPKSKPASTCSGILNSFFSERDASHQTRTPKCKSDISCQIISNFQRGSLWNQLSFKEGLSWRWILQTILNSKSDLFYFILFLVVVFIPFRRSSNKQFNYNITVIIIDNLSNLMPYFVFRYKKCLSWILEKV